MARPTSEHQNSDMPVNVLPLTVMTWSMPTNRSVTSQMAGIDSTAATITPLYIAHMMPPSEPSFTK